MEFSMKDFFSKCDPIRKKLLLKKSLMKTLFYAHCSFSAIATFLKSKLCHRSFFQDFCKFVKTQILQKKIVDSMNTVLKKKSSKTIFKFLAFRAKACSTWHSLFLYVKRFRNGRGGRGR